MPKIAARSARSHGGINEKAKKGMGSMQADRYTKAVLTVIAIALVLQVVQHFSSPSFAQVFSGAPDTGLDTPSSVTRVIICDPDRPNICAHISSDLGGILSVESH